MNAKELLLKNKKLVAWWVSVKNDDRFAQIVTYAKAIMMESSPSQEQMIGAGDMLTILETMTDNEDEQVPFPSPGLHHDIETKTTEE
jgi:hypothetical protein